MGSTRPVARGTAQGAATDSRHGRCVRATRRAVADAVHAVYLGVAGAAALAFLVLLVLAPRRFPVVDES
ncbi:hypothetical protein ACWCPM_28015 [Streptomyces sp. NPDC002309]